MNVSKSFPPNYKAIKAQFNPPDNVVFTYGSTIHAPFIDFKLPQDLIVHEETHERQQGTDPAGWWEKYMVDEAFRFNQELTAYRNQYRFFLKHNPRDKAFFFVNRIAKDLASSTYGNIVSYEEALKLIRQ